MRVDPVGLVYFDTCFCAIIIFSAMHDPTENSKVGAISINIAM